MRRVVPILLLLIACAPDEEQVQPHNTLRIGFKRLPRAIDRFELNDAIGELFGLEVLQATKARGSITLYVYEGSGPGGEAAGGDDCYRFGWCFIDPTQPMSDSNVESCAHEAGHLLRLQHDSDPKNLMNGSIAGRGYDLDEDQIETTRHEAGILYGCQ